MLGYLLLFVIAVVSAVAVYASRASGGAAAWRYTVLYRGSWLRARWGQWRAAGTMPHRIASALAASSPSTPLPPPTELIAWAESFLGTAGKLQHVEVSGDGLGGGFMGAMFKLLLTWDDDSADNVDNINRPRSLVVKTLTPVFARRLSSILLGNAREAYFYRNFASNLATFGSATERQEVRSVVPRVYHADGSWTTGDFVVVMEDLSTTGARLGSHVLGNQCWGPVKGFPAELQTESVGLQLIEQVFAAMADVHAAFWRDESLLGHSWLKAAEWLQGRDRARWELAIDGMRNKWLRIKRTIEQGKTGVKWSDEVVRAMDDSLAATSWETYQRSFDVTKPTTPFTLCHGDFHAANILWVPGRERTAIDGEADGARIGSKVYMVDWPEVGVGCPFTELAQFMISNASPELRRKHERRLFADYHARLVAKGVCGRTFPLEACWERYQRGGVERWLQMLTLMTLFGLPDASIGWYHDQVAAFVHDHHADASASLKGRSIPLMSAYPLLDL